MAAKISVVMPVFNSAAYLREALESILGQTFENWELVAVLDSRSSDGSKDILNEFSEKDARIKAIEDFGKGVSHASNLGISKSSASILARMDADDICEPSRLEEQFEFMEKNPQVGVLGANCTAIGASKKELHRIVLPENDAQLKRMLYFKPPFAHPTTMMRKKIIKRVGGYNESFHAAEDYDLWSRIYDKTDFHNLQKPLLKYRKQATNTTITKVRERVRVERIIIKRLEREMQIPLHWKIIRRAVLLADSLGAGAIRRAIWQMRR